MTTNTRSGYKPHDNAIRGLPTEHVTFEEALSITQEYYERQVEHPITAERLHTFLDMPDGCLWCLWKAGNFIYVYEGIVRVYRGSGKDRVIAKAARCLVIK